MKQENVFPQQEWEKIAPQEAGFRIEGLDKAKGFIKSHAGEKPFQVVIAQGGRIAHEWKEGKHHQLHHTVNSVGKSIFGNILGIALEEKKLSSADEKVLDYYPELMDVPEGEGPREARYAREKDKDITFRQLISNTSGYLRERQYPGKSFDYQTDGMNILTHAIGKIYNIYETANPEGSLGFKVLIEFKIGKKIGTNFQYSLMGSNLNENSRYGIFGTYCQVRSTILDMARLGWLWCNTGNWDGIEVIPLHWMEESIRTNADILANCPRENWKYGYGFWTNSHGVLWPSLPKNAFTAWGFGGNFITCFPESALVVVQSSVPYDIYDPRVEQFLGLILEAHR